MKLNQLFKKMSVLLLS